MKRFTALLITAAMLLPLRVFAADDADPQYYERAAKVLSALDIYNGGAGTEAAATRLEVVSALVGTATKNAQLSNENLIWADAVTDVPDDKKKIVDVAISRGIIALPKDGLFRPDDAAGYDFVMRAMVAAAGYTYEIHKDTYIEKGIDLKLLKGVRGGALAEGLKTGDISVMLYNLINAEYVYFESEMKSGISDRTVLERIYDIYKIKGQLTSTSTTDINGNVHLMGRNVEFTEKNTGSTITMTAPETDISQYIGRTSEVYYRVDDDENEILYIYPDDNDLIVYVEPENFVSFDLADRKMYYNTKISGSRWESALKQKSIKIPENVDIIYNGQYTTEHSYVYDVLEEPGLLNIADIALYDANSDGKGDLLTVNAYYDIHVDNINAKESVVTDKISGKKYDFLPDNPDDVVLNVYDTAGKATSFSGLKAGCVLSVYEGTGEPKLIRIVSSEAVQKTAADSMREDNGYIYVSTEAGELRLSGTLVYYKGNVKIGQSYTFYLNAYGVIAAAATDSSEYDNIGSVVSVRYIEDTETQAELKLYTAKGEFVTLKTAEKWFVDGCEVLADNEERRYIVQDGSIVYLIDKLKSSFIQFRKNSEGDIVRLNFAKKEAGEGELSYVLGMSHPEEVFEDPNQYKLYYKANQSNYFFPVLSGKAYNFISTKNETVYMKIPSKQIESNRESYYAITSNLSNDSEWSAVGYTFTPGSAIADIVVLVSDSAAELGATGLFVIKSMHTELDDEGEVGYVIDCYGVNGSAAQLRVNGFDIPEYSVDTKLPTGRNVTVNEGDVVLTAIDGNGYTIGIAKVYDSKTRTGINQDQNYWYSGKRYVYGSVYNIEGRTIAYVPGKEITPQLTLKENLNVIRVKTDVCIVVDPSEKRTERVSVKNLTEIEGYRQNPAEYDHVYLRSGYGECSFVVIFR